MLLHPRNGFRSGSSARCWVYLSAPRSKVRMVRGRPFKQLEGADDSLSNCSSSVGESVASQPQEFRSVEPHPVSAVRQDRFDLLGKLDVAHQGDAGSIQRDRLEIHQLLGRKPSSNQLFLLSFAVVGDVIRLKVCTRTLPVSPSTMI